jgi:EthD domain
MHELMTMIRKRPDISVADFRHFMEHEYGPIYGTMPEVKRYVQFFLDDLSSGGGAPPIDAIVQIAFASIDDMKVALATDAYRQAVERRKVFMLDGPFGIHPTLIAATKILV